MIAKRVDRTEMKRLAEQGMSSAQIAHALGSTAGTIRVLCCRAKIPIKRGTRAPVHGYRPPDPPRTDPQTEAHERLAALRSGGNPWD